MSYSFEETARLLEESTTRYGDTGILLKFVVDAQLPKRLSDFLKANGYDSIHTLELPDKNATTDKYIKEFAVKENRVLLTKDDDFLQSFIIEKKPTKLILIKTGNINNNSLMDIFNKGLNVIVSLIKHHAMIEITQEEIIVHD